MPALTLCVLPGLEEQPGGIPDLLRLNLPLLLFGEWVVGPELAAALVPELRTTDADRPRLDDLLRQATVRTSSAALVLLSGAVAPTAAWADGVGELALRDPPVLAWGRAWSRSGPEAGLRLDPPAEPSWILLPRGAWTPPPALADALAADPPAALPWLLELAAERGWPALDATEAVPLDRRGPHPIATPQPAPAPAGPQAGIQRLPITPADAPRLTLLLQGSGADQRRWRDALEGSSELGIELLPTEAGDWSQARGEWIGCLPAAADPPPLALLSALVRTFRNPWIDGVVPQDWPPVLRRGVLERLGPAAFEEPAARAAGLQLLQLPLLAASPPEEPDPLWQAAALQLERAEALLLAQQRRIAQLEAQLGQSRQGLTPPETSRPAAS